MSMLARKGTMVHRKSIRRTSHPALRRASQPVLRRVSVMGVSSSPRRSATLSSGVGQHSNSQSPTMSSRENSLNTSLNSPRRASVTMGTIHRLGPGTSVTMGTIHRLGPGIALPLEIASSSRFSPNSIPRNSLSDSENKETTGSVVISVGDRRHLYLKSPKEDSLKYSFYGSLSYQLHQANQEATGLVDFTFRALGIIGSMVLRTTFLVCLSVLPASMMIIGIQYLQDCPKQPNIPVYLLVGGAFGLIKIISTGWRQTRKRNYEQTTESLVDGNEEEILATTSSNITHYALSVFLLVWFIMGSYWVLVIYKPHYEPLLHDPNNWCAKTVYSFSVIHLCVCYGVMALVVVLLSFTVLCIRSCGVYDQNV